MNNEERKAAIPTHEKFIAYIEDRERVNDLEHYTPEEREFLWSEIFHKADDVQDAIFSWLMTGNVVNLQVRELVVPKGYLPNLDHDEVVSIEMLMRTQKMNVIAAAFTLDWVRRDPKTAMLVLHKGITPRYAESK